MTLFRRLNAPVFFKWVSSDSHCSRKTPFGSVAPLYCIVLKPRFYSTHKQVKSQDFHVNTQSNCRIPTKTRIAARAALLEYLNTTRSLQFEDAENMSRNSPHFLRKLLGKVDFVGGIGPSIARFLRYHPINEFEPFFESLGLKPKEYSPFLRRDLMFLTDDPLLLENYHVLCNYGVPRNKIGKIYLKATEIFGFDFGVLRLKLKAFEELGLHRSFMLKVLICSPDILTGDENSDFYRVVDILRKAGVEFTWIEERLTRNTLTLCDWRELHTLLKLLSKTLGNGEQLHQLIKQQPWLLFQGSGDSTLLLIGFLLKLGCTVNQISSLFLEFPQMQVKTFLSNLRRCFLVLTEVEMEPYEIGKIFHSHLSLLGSCTLKRTNSLLTSLNIGKKRLCNIIQENPREIKKWVIGSRVHPLPNPEEELLKTSDKTLKTKFLSDLGLLETSDKMEKALKSFRGKGSELQDRFDCIVEAGLDKKDVCEMIKRSPHILNQKKGVIQMKIDFLVNDLGCPVSTLTTFPSFLSYTIPRIKLRFQMYNWLKDQGVAEPLLALSTVLASSDKSFVSCYVKRHPRGPEIWKNLKEEIYAG
ncbi:hypothetical protein Tsubulata_031633 [Turnera subulata]|uniref:Uncharacterized protein n=1 Tax=Turnera subulata TaxID=218843 RepID=A0A9Q0FF45_9ROSI|nr:hypothetical protein Tsubulata_031633 [Turnera subulata]